MEPHSRREFLRRAAALSAAAGASGALMASIERARAIEPRPGSSFLDAEHVVILMQENRSFDHAFGRLRGVRGFNDPRAIALPNGSPVWVQTNVKGESYAPFRLNIRDSNATWMGCLPHSRSDQVDARNGGRYDRWLDAKKSGHERYAHMPLTMGYYDREDIPFYYALADAFTICDQHFCSVLTCTTPNRVYLWTGTSRDEQQPGAPVRLLNSEIDHDTEVSWTTFPERLEDHGVSWKIYQNELHIETGLAENEHPWLSNFGDNPIEHFTQYRLRFARTRRRYVQRRLAALSAEIEALAKQQDDQPAGARRPARELRRKQRELGALQAEHEAYSAENFAKLSDRDRSLHECAFAINDGDPDYRQLEELVYRDGDIERRMWAPKGDVFHQFRQDASSGQLAMVSWLVAPQAFSDHPDSAWFGAWYIAEALDILTQNPEVWKKTIFILTYDENDGYFDHVPPFVAPDPRRPDSGRVSPGIDAAMEFVPMSADLVRRHGSEARESSIGLGYRVPMVIASPWSRGGCVCSQVFDHTSPIQLVERMITHKTGRPLVESNISPWRRAVCGDLTAAFQPAPKASDARVPVPDRNTFLEGIHRAQFKSPPTGYRQLTPDDLVTLRDDPQAATWMPRQEPGVRPSAPLPYELAVDGQLSSDRSKFVIRFEARDKRFGHRSAGAPFCVRARNADGQLSIRDYAVVAGGLLEDDWPLAEFAGGAYRFEVYGPNGFYRLFRGLAADSLPVIHFESETAESEAIGFQLHLSNSDSAELQIELIDNAYGNSTVVRALKPHEDAAVSIETAKSFGWYDLCVHIRGVDAFEQRYAGRIEAGQWTYSDPAMGGVPPQ